MEKPTVSRTKWYTTLLTLSCVAANGVSSIALIFLNKVLYRRYNFPSLTLTCVHFLVTSIGMQLCCMAGLVKWKYLSLHQILPISIMFCGFVVFSNLSLQHNTVGTYQVIKTMTVPGVLLIQTYFYQKKFSTKIKMTLVPIVVGVFFNSNFDLAFNLTGVIYGGLGALVTSLYQVWVGEKQRELHASSGQLLYYQAPMSALCLALLIPLLEPTAGVLKIWPTEALVLVAVTGVIAFFVNLTIFWIIGNTSPLTYNVVGQFKFSITLLGGVLLFEDPVQPLQVYCGISLTLLGVFSYTFLKLRERQDRVLPQKTISHVMNSQSCMENHVPCALKNFTGHEKTQTDISDKP